MRTFQRGRFTGWGSEGVNIAVLILPHPRTSPYLLPPRPISLVCPTTNSIQTFTTRWVKTHVLTLLTRSPPVSVVQ